MNAMENTQLLDSDENIRAAIVKLPHELIASWERHCVSKFQDTEPISFQELVEFVERQALARDNPRYGHDEIFKEKSKDKADNTHTKNSKTRMTGNQMTYRQNTTLTTNANASHANSQDFSDSASMGSCAFCQLKNHTLKDCYSIQMTGSATKKNFFYANNMCTRCGEHRCKDQDHQCLPKIKCRVCSSTSQPSIQIRRMLLTAKDNIPTPVPKNHHGMAGSPALVQAQSQISIQATTTTQVMLQRALPRQVYLIKLIIFPQRSRTHLWTFVTLFQQGCTA